MNRSIITTEVKKKHTIVATHSFISRDVLAHAGASFLTSCLIAFFALLISSTAPIFAQTQPPVYNGEVPIYEAGQVLVELDPGISPQTAEDISFDLEAIVTTIPNIEASFQLWFIPTVVVTSDGTTISSVEEAISHLQRQPGVIRVQPNFKYYLNSEPNDPNYKNLWGLNNKSQTSGTDDADIDCPEAWTKTTGGKTRVAGVVDTGIDYNHEDLTPNVWNNLAEDADGDGQTLEWNPNTQSWELDPGDLDGIDNDNNGYIDDLIGWDFANDDNDPMDTQGHGTHVSGTIGAVGNNGVGITGVCWTTQIMALKIFEGSSGANTDKIIEAVEYAAQMNADVVNNSWGIAQDVPELYPNFDELLQESIQKTDKLGDLWVFSSGNDGKNTDIAANYPSGYADPEFDIPNIISVAATDHHDRLASFGTGRGSNFGYNTVDIAAPGHSILSCLPNNKYASWNGTSMAAPHVTGAILLIWAQYPNLTHHQVKKRLLESVDLLPSLQFKVRTNGRLNVARALGMDDCSVTAEFTNNTTGNATCTHDSIIFTPTSIQPNWSYHWKVDGISYPTTNATLTLAFPKAGQHNIELEVRNDLLENCITSSLQSIIVQPTPIPNFTVYTDCAAKKFIIENTSTGVTTTNYTWLINGVEVEGTNNSSFDYPIGDFDIPYTFALIVKNGVCSDNYSTRVTPTELVVDFTSELNGSDCTQSHYQFTNQTVGANDAENQWFVNNRPVATSVDFAYQFPTTGSYTVRLVVSANGCTVQKETEVTVAATLKAGFTYTDNAINCGETSITFTSNPISNDNVMISWDIDGEPIPDEIIVKDYLFTEAGDYSIKLTLTDMVTGCSDIAIDTITIAAKPIASFTYDLLNCDGEENGFEVAFSSEVIASGEVTYLWMINGQSYTTENVTHSFNTTVQQSFSASLIVNYGGCDSELFETIIDLPLIPTITDIDAVLDCTQGFVRLEPILNVSDISKLTFEWTVDNNSVGTDSSVYHLPVQETANYRITLIVRNELCSNTFSKILNVSRLPKPFFKHSCEDGSLKLVDESTLNGNTGVTYSWTINGIDAGTGTEPANFDLTEAGVYEVELTLNTSQCPVTYTSDVVINAPNASFSYEIKDLNIVATPNLSGAKTYDWNFGNGDGSEDIVPTHIYAIEGTYKLCLTVTECISATHCEKITVQAQPPLTPTGQDSIEVVQLYLSLHGATISSYLATVSNDIGDHFSLLNTTDPLPDWEGVTVDQESGRVIDIVFNNLFPDSLQTVIGRIPPLDLPELSGLSLRNNRIGGTLNIDGLPKLKTLDVSNNAMGGILPDFVQQTNLTHLNLNNNEFSGTFPNIDPLLGSIQSMNISNNKLTFDGLEHAINMFAELVNNGDFLYAPQAEIPLVKESRPNNDGGGTLLTVSSGGTPEKNTYEWSHKTDLLNDWIVVSDAPNEQKYVPTVKGWYRVRVQNADITRIGKAGEGQDLVLATNAEEVTNLPDSGEEEPQLPTDGCLSQDSLELKKIYDNLPPEDQTTLDGMGWFVNPIETWEGIEFQFPPIDTCKRIAKIDLNDLGLTGAFPTDLNLPELIQLYVNKNEFSGELNLIGLPKLRELNVSGNQLEGGLTTLSHLPELTILNTADNNFSGSFPDLTSNPLLTFCRLDNNDLSGALPADLSHLEGLTTFSINDNNFTGNFPDISNWTNLANFNAGNCQLTGALPTLSQLTNLGLFIINDNNLSGDLPDLSGLTSLIKLEIDHNQLTGDISSISNLAQLENIYLSNNLLSGDFPSLDNLTNLYHFDFSGNRFTGLFPDLSSLDNITYLNASHNSFTFTGLEAAILWANDSNNNILDTNFVYAPQASLPVYQEKQDGEIIVTTEITVDNTSTITLLVDAGESITNNTYYWYKDNQPTPIAVISQNNRYEVPSDSLGNYHCKIINSVATPDSIPANDPAGIIAINQKQNLILCSDTVSLIQQSEPTGCPPQITNVSGIDTLCDDLTQIILVATDATYTNYAWFRASDDVSVGTTDTLIVTEADSYYLVVGDCSDPSDTILINDCKVLSDCPEAYNNSLTGVLPDTSLCIGDVVAVHLADFAPDFLADTYAWTRVSDNKKFSDSLSVLLTDTGTYELFTTLFCSDSNTTSGTNNLTATATFVVALEEDCTPENCSPQIENVSGTEVLCDSDSIVLTSTNVHIDYTWHRISAGDTSIVGNEASLIVSKLGHYILTSSDCPSEASDTVNIHLGTIGEDCIPNECLYPAQIKGDFVLCDNPTKQDTIRIMLEQAYLYTKIRWETPSDIIITEEARAKPILVVIATGIYTVEVTDINGCKSTASIEILNSPSQNLDCPSITNQSNTNFICEGDTIVLRGAYGFYDSYIWQKLLEDGTLSEPLIEPSISPLFHATQPGNYMCTMGDKNGNIYTDAYAICTFDIPTAFVTSSGETCANQEIMLMVSGTDTIQHTYQWSTGATKPATMVSESGLYSVTITDMNANCSVERQYEVELSAMPSLPTITTNAPVCAIDTTSIVLSDLTTDWAYQIMSSDTIIDLMATAIDTTINIKLLLTEETLLTIAVVDLNNCINTIDTTLMIQSSPIIPTIIGESNYCMNNTLQFSLSNFDVANDSVVWEFNGTVISTSPVIDTIIVTPQTIEASFTIFNKESQCQADTTFTIEILSQPEQPEVNANESVCAGDTISLNLLTIYNEEVVTTWLINEQEVSRESTFDTIFTEPQTLVVQFTAEDPNTSCQVDTAFTIIILPKPEQPQVNYPLEACIEQVVSIALLTTYNEEVVTTWLINEQVVSAESTFDTLFTEPQTLTVQFTAEDPNTPCRVDTTFTIEILPKPEVYIEGNQTICPPDPDPQEAGYFYDGTYTDPFHRGSFLKVVSSDSTVIIDQIEWAIPENIHTIFEEGDSIFVNNEGIYEALVSFNGGCNTTITIDIAFYDVATISLSEDIDVCGQIIAEGYGPNAFFDWFYFDQNGIISASHNSPTYVTPIENTTVGVVVTDTTTTCRTSATTSINSLSMITAVNDTLEEDHMTCDGAIIPIERITKNDDFDEDSSIKISTKIVVEKGDGSAILVGENIVYIGEINYQDTIKLRYQLTNDMHCTDEAIIYMIKKELCVATQSLPNYCAEPLAPLLILLPPYEELGLDPTKIINLVKTKSEPNGNWGIVDLVADRTIQFLGFPLPLGNFILTQTLSDGQTEAEYQVAITVVEDCPEITGKQRIMPDQENGTLGNIYTPDNGEIDLDEQIATPNTTTNTNPSLPAQTTNKQAQPPTLSALQHIKVHPVPAQDLITLDFMTMEEQAVLVEIYNTLGQRVATHKIAAQAGRNQEVFQISDYPAGQYQLRLLGNTSTKTVKFIKD